MAKIMVGGGFNERIEAVQAEQAAALGRSAKTTSDNEAKCASRTRLLAAALGSEIVGQGHTLYTGALTHLDRIVAESAATKARSIKRNPNECVVTYTCPGSSPSHSIGTIRGSAAESWDRIGRKLRIPEPVGQSDVLILLGGWEGTHVAANWARLANKPLLPIAGFGLAAQEIYHQELDSFNNAYCDRVSRNDYEVLNQYFEEFNEDVAASYAADIVSLAERIISPSTVFIIMSFAKSIEYNEIYKSFVDAAKQFKLNAYRIDRIEDRSFSNIVPEIYDGIKRSAFVIADITEPKPNVFYELGYARGIAKDIITTCKDKTNIPFDIFDVPVLYWNDSADDLRTKLINRIKPIAERLGRSNSTAR